MNEPLAYDEFLKRRAQPRRLGTGGTVLLFLAVFFAMQWAWNQSRDTAVERLVIHQATVRPAVFLINLFDGTAAARAEGARITSPSGGINILNGCEGTEALFLLVAAFSVAPLALRAKLSGLLLGTMLIYGLNQLRIVALFHAWRDNRFWFDVLHGYVAPTAIVMAVLAFFYLWQRRAATESSVQP